MRVTIERGYQPTVKALMKKLQVSDPKLAVQHIIGCWLAGGCTGSASHKEDAVSTDEFSDAIEW
jgi:hypothetical protein